VRFRFNKSLRWRLQFWHAILLSLVLVGFGWTAWSLQKISTFNRIDQELEQQVRMVAPALRPHKRPPYFRSGDIHSNTPIPEMAESEALPPPPPPRREFDDGEPKPFHDLEEIEFDDSPVYTVVWEGNGSKIIRSLAAPSNTPPPPPETSLSVTRMRGDLREIINFLPEGKCFLVGRNIRAELLSLRSFAWILSAVGGVVLLASLGIGWLLTLAVLRPLLSISSTATQIAEGDLSQRIPVPEADSEIADLVGVLNRTFSRLEASFVRQAQFTADASHELRTPLSIILTHTQNALARDRSSTEYRESLEACQRAARRMKELAESLLALVRLDHRDQGRERGPCNLDLIAGDAIDLLSPLAAEHRISLSGELDPASCMGHPEQLSQIVVNLVTNAIRYNSPGGRVLVRTVSQPHCILLTVSDTGRGIACEDIPHLFERFYRADKARSGNVSGAGLGLAITREIVQAHGGKIEVSSELGAGSLFTIYFPHLEKKLV